MTEDLKGRTCETCACMFKTEPPRVPTAAQLQENPHLLTAKAVMVCRLNPPALVATDQGVKLMQQITQAYFSCWQWKEPGTLPGDALRMCGEVAGAPSNPGIVVRGVLVD
jgi:hypothetical protein